MSNPRTNEQSEPEQVGLTDTGEPLDVDATVAEVREAPHGPDQQTESEGATQDASSPEVEDEQVEGRSDPDGEDEQDAGGNREAAKYRRRLRETEAERDLMADQVVALRRRLAEQAVTSSRMLEKPAALWLEDDDPSSLFDEQGELDQDHLRLRAEALVSKYGIGRRAPRPNPAQGRVSEPSGRRSPADIIAGR